MAGIGRTEIAVIGGGIIGCAVAYFLARAGADVTVIERGELASGTSSRCDGNILVIDKEPGFDSLMAVRSQQIVAQLSRELDEPFEYRAPGSILVCENDEELEAAAVWVDSQRNNGLPFRMLDRGDLRQESKYLADDLTGGLECVSDSTVNPYKLTYALSAGARRCGVSFLLHTRLTGMTALPGGGFRLATDRGEWTADKVVNAAGVWAPALGRMVGLDVPIVPRKGHLIVAARQTPIGLRKVMEFSYLMAKFGKSRTVDPLTDRYGAALVFEPTESQNFLIGSSREFVGFDTRVDEEAIRAVARRAMRFYPRLGDFRIIRTYAGLRPWTRDHLPIVSAVDCLPGYYIAAGHEGDGISLSAITGRLMRDIVLGQPPEIDAAPLRFERFAEGERRS